GAHEIGGELPIVGRVGEDEIAAPLGEATQGLQTIIDNDTIGRLRRHGTTTRDHERNFQYRG
ncbi:MAG: hypothetical protein KAI25_04385, partial [Hyphomicrobiaceae bacterium]|nr:hypothetical protein [Hyphomicrobiaceae bacterium]